MGTDNGKREGLQGITDHAMLTNHLPSSMSNQPLNLTGHSESIECNAYFPSTLLVIKLLIKAVISNNYPTISHFSVSLLDFPIHSRG